MTEEKIVKNDLFVNVELMIDTMYTQISNVNHVILMELRILMFNI